MIKTIIQFDYYLAKWFASSDERIVPGASFLFLNQVSFIAVAICCILIAVFPFKISTGVIVGGLMGVVLLIMYGFRKHIERYIYKQDYNELYKALNKKQHNVNKIIGLVLFIAPIFVSFIIMIWLLDDYANI